MEEKRKKRARNSILRKTILGQGGIYGQAWDSERVMGVSTRKEKMVVSSHTDYAFVAGIVDILYPEQRCGAVYLYPFLNL